MAVRGGPVGGAGAAGARRALCLLALAHSLAATSAQAPKPLWEKDLKGGNKPRGLQGRKGKPQLDLAAAAAKKGKAKTPFRNAGKPGAKPKPAGGDPPKPPPPDRKLKAPLKPGSWGKGPAKEADRRRTPFANVKTPFGSPGKLPPEEMKKKMMEAKKGGKKFKSHQDAADRRKKASGRKPPPKKLPKQPWPKNLEKPNPFAGKKASATVVFINEAPDAKDVEIFWVKSRKPHWPPLTNKKPGSAVRVRCRFGRRSGKAVQTVEELRGDLQVRGEFNITVRTDWSPVGSPHFLKLVNSGFFNGTAIFRAVQGFLAQFGVSHDDSLQQKFGSATIKDDRPRPWLLPLRRGTVAFAGSGAESRTSQLWISFADGVAGEQAWETPIGYIQAREGLEALDDINTEYGDLAMFNGSAPDPNMMAKEDGLDYLLKGWPNLEYFESCADEGPAEEEPPGAPEEELELVGTVEAGKQLTQTTQRGSTFITRLKGSSEELKRVVVKKPREFVQLSEATVSEL